MNVTLSNVFEWDAVGGASAYDWQLVNDGEGIELATGSLAGTSVAASTVLAGLSPATYKFRVRAKNGSLTSAWSAYLAFDFVGLEVPGNVRID